VSQAVELQSELERDPNLRRHLAAVSRRPPLAPHLETDGERAVAAWLPRDAHAEQCLLGACLVHKTAQPIIGLEAGEFFYLYHQRLAAAILDLAENHRPVNLQTVRSFLNADTTAVPDDYFLVVMSECLADVTNKNSRGLR
jgi:hypothetical protein